MRPIVVWGAFALAAVMAGPAHAETSTASGAQSAVPTVTIINKTPDATGTPPPELVVRPSAPERPWEPRSAPSISTPSDAPQAAPVVTPAPAESGPADAAVSSSSGAGAAATITTGRAAEPPASSAEGQSEAAAAPAPPPPEPTLAIDIDLTQQTMTVSEHGEKSHTWLISSARYGYRTPTGTYQPTWMAKMWYSRQYDYAPMPHAIFFHQGVAIHATYAIRALGRPASHGCVRLAPKNAAALFKLVNTHGKDRTKIVVHGRPEHSDEYVASDDRPRTRERVASERQQMRRGSPAYRYLPPSDYGRGNAAYYAQRGYGSYAPRTRRHYAAPVRPPRGFIGGYSYGYGF